MRFPLKHVTLAIACMATLPAHATNGYFLPGFGVKSQGAGGVGIALAADSLSQAANPANATQTGMRGDLGLSLFNPERKSATGSAADPSAASAFQFDTADKSGNRLYLMPDMAFTMPLSGRLSVGLAVVGNGGMNTTYSTNPFGRTGDTTTPHGGVEDVGGVDLMQIIAPVTVAYKVTPQHSVGASLNLAAQRFKANGLGQFVSFGISADPSHLTNNGYDYSYGAGVRLGWVGKFLDDRISVGATWASRTYMTRFDKYAGLFAEQGDFDIPENFGFGLAIKPTDSLTAAFDVVRINYSEIASVGNPGPGTDGGSGIPLATLFTMIGPATNPLELGNDGGMGFGWKDMTVYKLGLIYDVNEDLTVRAGYNYAKHPIRQDQGVFSALAPAVVEKHYSVGFTYQMKSELDWEISGTYMYVPEVSFVSTGNAITNGVAFSMHQHILGVGFGIKY